MTARTGEGTAGGTSGGPAGGPAGGPPGGPSNGPLCEQVSRPPPVLPAVGARCDCLLDYLTRERGRNGIADLHELRTAPALPRVIGAKALENGGLTDSDSHGVSAAALVIAARWVSGVLLVPARMNAGITCDSRSRTCVCPGCLILCDDRGRRAIQTPDARARLGVVAPNPSAGPDATGLRRRAHCMTLACPAKRARHAHPRQQPALSIADARPASVI